MAKARRPRFQMAEVRSLLDASDVQCLAEELGEWRDNLDGANMSHLPKYEEVSEAADALESIAQELETAITSLLELLEVDATGKVILAAMIQVRTSKARQSRSDRASEVSGSLETAIDAIRAGFMEGTPVYDATEEVLSQAEELNSVSFPGMY